MARATHHNPNKIDITPVAQGTMLSLPAADGGGYVRRPAPADGLYFEPDGGERAFFVAAEVLRVALEQIPAHALDEVDR